MPRPYTYLLVNQADEWYIGVRTANRVPAEQDTSYMSSSAYLKNRIKAGETFTKHILGEYETNEEACAAEDVYLREHWDIPGRINKALGYKTYEFDKEVLLKRAASIKKAVNAPEVRAKRSTSMKAALASPEARTKKKKIGKLLWQDPQHRAKICKSCTVDGITIYASRKELVEALGHNKNGDRHPNFRYI